jgi:hypothetical protein
MSVSHSRLDRVYANRRHSTECLTEADMQRIKLGLDHALGFLLS